MLDYQIYYYYFLKLNQDVFYHVLKNYLLNYKLLNLHLN